MVKKNQKGEITMGNDVCPICHNLSDNCMYCGGTNKTKEERGFKVCPTCHNQSDHCMTCGGNSRLKKSKAGGDKDEY
jgi:hypothetical protein